tara:strand:- start:68 stop:295 length:228 start_codon:yes stop_codon:yes gene_type:complete
MKNLTNKEIQFHLSKLHKGLDEICQVLDGMGNLIRNYITYRGDEDKFLKFMKKKSKEMEKKDGHTNTKRPKSKAK